MSQTFNLKALQPLDSGASNRKNAYRLIQESDFFTGFEDEEAKILSQWMRAYSAETGCVILSEGEKSNRMCVITKGLVGVFKQAPHDEQMRVAELSAGETIGEMGILDDEPFSASVIASEYSIVLMISKQDFEEIVKQHHAIGNKLLWKLGQVLTERLRQTTKRLAPLLTGKD